MQLMAYLKDCAKTTVPAFAEQIGEPVGTIHKIAYRQRQPSLGLALKITEATGGAVQPIDLAITEQATTSQEIAA